MGLRTVIVTNEVLAEVLKGRPPCQSSAPADLTCVGGAAFGDAMWLYVRSASFEGDKPEELVKFIMTSPGT